MSKKLSYADAVKLLGGADSKLVKALDRLTGGLLLAVSGGGSVFVLNLFDAKGELAQLSGELISSLSDRLRGLSRFDRSQRLAAAHKVIVLTAFFEALRGTDLPFPLKELRLEKTRELELGTGQRAHSVRMQTVARILNDSDVPTYTTRDGAATMPQALGGFYASLGENLLAFIADLAIWRELAPGPRSQIEDLLRNEVPTAALLRYDELFRRLASDFPEVAYWANHLDHETTRAELDRLHMGLEGLGGVLERLAVGQPPDDRREALARSYRKQLERPVVAMGDVPDGMTIPSLASAYINPAFRAAPVIRSDRLDEEPWWDRFPVRDDLQEFLVGHLTSPQATEFPLIVLGQPGSGKSVLTKVLSARLPPSDFLVVRVVLREVPADTDLQSQIEYAIRHITGESLSWPSLTRAAGDALPVVLLDGFDELLQATGIGQTDYLEQVVRFQERETDQGRPVAVIVTSRTAVADRARIPPGGAVAVRLEPFSEAQVKRWLSVWNATNATHFARRALRPLTPAAVLRQAELASQPLLLLMLALYDATDNALQREGKGIDQAGLYDRILLRFAEREILKSDSGLDHVRLRDAVEQELLRLSIAAFAMFNRGHQWATEDELSLDLTALFGNVRHSPDAGFAAASTPGQIVVGRFFFVHQAQAVRNDIRLATCEFLHSTFGEFLIARLIVRELKDLATVSAVTTTRNRQVADDGFLRSLISFAPLTMRSQIIEFLRTLCDQFSPEHRRILREVLLDRFHACWRIQLDTGQDDYEPVPLNTTARLSAYSANLLILSTLIGSPLAGRELFPDVRFPAQQWRRTALLWRSQFTAEGRRSLTAALRLERTWRDGEREVVISLGPWTPPPHDAFWIYKIPPEDPRRTFLGWGFPEANELRKESYFTCYMGEDIAWHGIEPFMFLPESQHSDIQTQDQATTWFGVLSQDDSISTVHALVRLWLTSGQPGTPTDLGNAYLTCLAVINNSRPEGHPSLIPYLILVLRQLAADIDRLPADFGERVRHHFPDMFFDSEFLRANFDVSRWASHAFGSHPTGY